MGMYTEIYVNCDLVENTPQELLDLLQAMSEMEYENPVFNVYPTRFKRLFCSGSFYTPDTNVCKLTYNDISNQYSFIGKGDIKNYDGEIQEFFELIKPHAEDEFVGYYRYEEDREPVLVYKN